jgi:hypothetical protein
MVMPRQARDKRDGERILMLKGVFSFRCGVCGWRVRADTPRCVILCAEMKSRETQRRKGKGRETERAPEGRGGGGEDSN